MIKTSRRGLAQANLPALGLGLSGDESAGAHKRLSLPTFGLLGAFSKAAAYGQADLDGLSLARELLLRKCE